MDNKTEAYYLNAGVLFSAAKKAYNRLGGAASDTEPGLSDAMVAILFSAMALEAFIAEFAINCRIAGKLSGKQWQTDLSAIIDEAESYRGSPKLKFLLAKAVMPGKSFDKGGQPYQDLHLLFSLRDSIVHAKPERISEEPTVILKRLRDLGLASPAKADTITSVLSDVTTRAVAKWACNIAVRVVASFRESCPVADPPSSILDTPIWDSSFQPIE